MRLIADGVVDREGVRGLAARLGYTERHIHRRLVAAVGAGALALARAQRAQTARILLETTAMPITGVAFAAGFHSVRQFNATIQEIFAASPTALRVAAHRHGQPEDSGALSLRLPYRAPLDAHGLIAFLGLRCVPGVEEVCDGAYRRSHRPAARAGGTLELRPADGYVHARYWLEDVRDLGAAMQRSASAARPRLRPPRGRQRRSVATHCSERSCAGARAAGSRTRRRPRARRARRARTAGLRPRCLHARRAAGDRPRRAASPAAWQRHARASLTAHALAGADPERLGMPRARGRALNGLATALASGELVLDAGVARDDARRQLLALTGIGPWTSEYIAMRALRDPDAYLPSDLGVRRALEALGHDGQPAAAQAVAERWRPYRAYAVQHLWASLHASPASDEHIDTAERREPTIAA